MRLRTTYVRSNSNAGRVLSSKLISPLTRDYSLEELLKRPELKYADLTEINKHDPSVEDSVSAQVTIQLKYAGYIDRQKKDVDRLQRHETMEIPSDLDFSSVEGLSNEVQQKLTEMKPTNFARAGRIPGVTPAALSLLLVYLKKRDLRKTPSASARG
ncbi:MAG: hypothetical protein FI699_09545 [SAR202 cluster bacterium]|nr:hypothetical protein [SAR202 cluster bacterium]